MITLFIGALVLAGLLALLLKLTIIIIVLWGIFAVLQYFGVVVHPVVRIVFIVVISIIAVYMLFYLLTAIL